VLAHTLCYVGDKSSIEWTEATWNPTTGCDRISRGCDHCYALTLAKRLKAMGTAKYQTDGDPRTSGPGFGVAVHPGTLALPLRWREPRIVFVNSMSDLFHARVSDEFILRVFAVMQATPRHTYQVLTKRSPRLRRLAPRLPWPENVWMGVSVEDDDHVRRVDDLRHVPAAVRFISAEPLLGPLPSLDLEGVDWLIAGGESGHRARPVDASWVVDLRDACADAEVAFFFKQWGGRTPKAGGRDLEGRTWDALPLARPRWPLDNRVEQPQHSAAADGWL
jgi:protein gp37